MKSNRASAEYDEKLLSFIESYTREVGVPPTIEQMIENVGELSSKSSVSSHLTKMVYAGLLTQKNVKGYYYPTSLEMKEIMIPRRLIEEACISLLNDQKNLVLVKEISSYLK